MILIDCTDYTRADCRVRQALLAYMDIRTLLVWRTVCRSAYYDVLNELRGSLRLILADFVPSPDRLLSLVTRTRALITGELALSYLLRDARLPPHSLDIHIGNVFYDEFVDDFFNSSALIGYQTHVSVLDHPEHWISSRHITQTVVISLSNQRTIAIHASASSSACQSIACSPTTLGTTFVTEHCFATAYPCLTLNYRAIICRDELTESMDSELDVYDRLEEQGFSYEVEPTAWLENASQRDHKNAAGESICMRSLHICPQQVRHFGDRGSMLTFMDPLNVDLNTLKDGGIPPYGIMAVWRMPSSVLCDKQCDELDGILMPGMLVAPMMFETTLSNTVCLPTLRTHSDVDVSRPAAHVPRRRTHTV